MRDDFGIFILSHGRPAEVSRTIRALTKARYTGHWWIVLDTEDTTADDYAARWGADRLLTFDKDQIAETFDLADNGGPRGVIVYARNAVDRGDSSVSFRAHDDTEARRIADTAMSARHRVWSLTTGLGVHRRTVEV